ncbi:8327_t:CDS:2, partial [Gigaspora margarita]
AITGLEEDRLNEIVDTHNSAVKIIKEAKKIGISFGNQIWEENIKLTNQGTKIVGMLSARAVKSFLKRKLLQLFVVKQLFDSDNSAIISWEHLNNLRNQKGLGQKPLWIKELKEICITNSETKKLKEVYKQKKRNTLAMKPELKTIDTDGQKSELIVFKNKKENIKPNENIIEQYKGYLVDKQNQDVRRILVEERKVHSIIVEPKEKEIINEWIESEKNRSELKGLWRKIKCNVKKKVLFQKDTKKEKVDLMVAKAVEKMLFGEEKDEKLQNGIKERKRKKIPETGNKNKEEEIERSKKRRKTKESNKKNNVASETKQEKFSKIYCGVKEIIYKWIAGFVRLTWLSSG